MTRIQRIGRAADWKHLVVEFVLIVAGVIAALGAQAWWESRDERQRERGYLRQLASDAIEIERRLDAALAEEAAAGATTASLLNAIRQEMPLPLDSLRTWISPPIWPFWYSDPRVVMGTVATLQETGDMRILRDDGVRAALSSYKSIMDAEWTEFSRWVDQQIDLATRFYHLGSLASDRQAVPEGLSTPAGFVFAMRNDPEFRAILVGIRLARSNRVLYLRRMREATEQLRRSVERGRLGRP